MKGLNRILMVSLLGGASALQAQTPWKGSYGVESSVVAFNGDVAPIWLTGNRNGMLAVDRQSAYLRADAGVQKAWKNDWNLAAGLSLAGGVHTFHKVWVQQAFADLNWRGLQLSLGAKERTGFPLEKDLQLSSGMMVEGANAKPIPQLRFSVNRWIDVPFTRGWLGFKGHLAYGWFTDGSWQEDFAAPGQRLVKEVLYHSKSAALKVGKEEVFPWTFELGLLDVAQYGGIRYKKLEDGSLEEIKRFPKGLKSFIKALVPAQESNHKNVEGNHLGSWNTAINYYGSNWKARIYLEHNFEDHSQMFMEYGFWKDGQLGVEVTLPKNRILSKFLWEGLNTTDQAGPINYEGFAGSHPELQMHGHDNYFNHGEYEAWQHVGMGMTTPLIPGPNYNTDGTITYKSNRVKAHHVGFCGEPHSEWNYRVLASYVRHWGTYSLPLDKVRKQFSGLVEITFHPNKLKGWSASCGIAMDRGNYLGNGAGVSFTLRKTGGF